MAGIKPTEKLLFLIEEIIEDNTRLNLFTIEEINSLKEELRTNCLRKESLKLILKYLKIERKKENLNDFIRGSKLIFPSFIKNEKEETIGKKKRKEYLVKKQQVRQYNQMIHGCER